MKKICLITVCSGLLAASQPALSADAGNGATLHDKNCTSCHDDGVYKRKDRRVTTMDGLNKQVKRCELSLGLKWFDSEIEDVAAYLNNTYYQLK